MLYGKIKTTFFIYKLTYFCLVTGDCKGFYFLTNSSIRLRIIRVKKWTFSFFIVVNDFHQNPQ